MLPAKEGPREIDTIPGAGELHQLRVSQAATLADLQKDYVLFSHGLLLTHGKWPSDPVREYVLLDPSCQVGQLDMPFPVFRWPGEWSSRLMLCPRESWEGLFNYLKGTAYLDVLKQRYRRAGGQIIPIPDALALAKRSHLPGVIPTVSVLVFYVDGESGCVVMAPPAKDDPIGLFHPTILPAETETIRTAETYFRGGL